MEPIKIKEKGMRPSKMPDICAGGVHCATETEMILYGLKTCDTCRKALKSLPEAEFVDVRADGMPEGVLEMALAQFGTALVNARSTTWRGLSEEQRGQAPLDLLRAHPTLMKRPLIVVGDGQMHLGWTAQTRTALGVS